MRPNHEYWCKCRWQTNGINKTATSARPPWVRWQLGFQWHRRGIELVFKSLDCFTVPPFSCCYICIVVFFFFNLDLMGEHSAPMYLLFAPYTDFKLRSCLYCAIILFTLNVTWIGYFQPFLWPLNSWKCMGVYSVLCLLLLWCQNARSSVDTQVLKHQAISKHSADNITGLPWSGKGQRNSSLSQESGKSQGIYLTLFTLLNCWHHCALAMLLPQPLLPGVRESPGTSTTGWWWALA